MKTYEEMMKAWKKVEGYKKFYGKESLQYKKALKAYNKAFRGFMKETVKA